MKNIQKIRFGVQLLCIVLTVIGFFTDYRIVSGIIFVAGIIGGVFFCGWICPFGTLQDLFSKAGAILGVKKIKMPRSIQKVMVILRYIVFAVAMLVTLDIVFEILSLDPRTSLLAALTGQGIGLAAAGVMVLFALLSMVFERPFCNYLCMEGAKHGLSSTLRPFTIIRDENSCVDCNQCNKACPMNIDVAKCQQMHSPQCINCMKCISACPVKGTLKYGIRQFNKKQIHKYIIIVVVIAVGAVVTLMSGLLDGESMEYADDNEDFVVEKVEEVEEVNKEIVVEKNEETNTDIENQEVEPIITDTETIATMTKVDGYRDGTYEGSGQGFKGQITVAVTIKDSIITNIEVIDHRDDRKWFNRANNVIPNEIVEKQTANVDVVGGATYSSQGIIDGVKDALSKAKE